MSRMVSMLYQSVLTWWIQLDENDDDYDDDDDGNH